MSDEPTEWDVEVREHWALRWPDGTVSGSLYSGDGSDHAERMVRSLAVEGSEVVHRTETITRTPWESTAFSGGGEPACGRLDDHHPHVWTTPSGGPYSCDGVPPVTEGGWGRCPGCLTSGRPHPVGGVECRESAREKAISQGDE